MGNTKVCSKCKVEKELEGFHKKTVSKDGRRSICRECCKRYNQIPEVKANKSRNAQTPKRKASRVLRYSERKQNNTCTHCSKNLPFSTSLLCTSCWFKQVSIRHFKTVKYVETLEQLAESQNYICPLTGDTLIPGKNMSLDHILCKSANPNLKHTFSNLRWVTTDANLAKHVLTDPEFIELCHKVVKTANSKLENKPDDLLSKPIFDIINRV